MKHNFIRTFKLVLLITLNTVTYAQETSVDEKVQEISNKYANEWNDIKKDGEALKEKTPEGAETAVGVDLDCKMETQDIKLDIPQVSMKLQKISLDLPQVSMKTKKITWDNPETRMETTTCGWYPEFHGLKIKMSRIKCDLPQVRMVRREAKLDIPEFKWDRTDIKTDIPEFRMETKKISFDLPACKVKNVSAERKKISEESAQIEARANALSERQRNEINTVVASDLIGKRQETDNAFAESLSSLNIAISKVKEFGIDPTQVKQEDGTTVNLIAKQQELQSRRETEIAKLDKIIQDFSLQK